MKKRLWLVPFLSAAYWASCREPIPNVHNVETDIRYGVCAWCVGMITLLVLTGIPINWKEKL